MNLFIAIILCLILNVVAVVHARDVRAERRRRAIKRSRAMHPSNYGKSFRP